MIKGAVKWLNPQTKETKQICICGAKLPKHYNVHLGCLGYDEEALSEARSQSSKFFEDLKNDNNAEHH